MEKIIILSFISSLFGASVVQVFGANTECAYKSTEKGYTCSIESVPYDEVKSIGGTHETKKSDKNVEILEISSDTYAKNFQTIFCKKFPNLVKIEVNHRAIDSLDQNSFKGCKKLRELAITSKNFGEISENFLSSVPHLKTFSIKSNALPQLGAKTFNGLVDLEVLNLSENNIYDLPEDIFKPLVNLKKLLLTNNNIIKLKFGWFRSLENLEDLRIEENKIEDLPKNIFASLKKVNLIYAFRNNIVELHSDSFGDLKQPIKVYLMANKITAVERNFKSNIELDYRFNPCTYGNGVEKYVVSSVQECYDNYKPRQGR